MLRRSCLFYIHWPFCESLCPYCDFNSFLVQDDVRQNMLSAYLSEIQYYSEKIQNTNYEIKTIFFGGGTPSLMTPQEIAEIIIKIKKQFICSQNIEITLEANPGSSDYNKFCQFADSGINRISIGIQSFDDNNLKILGRKHTAIQARKALDIAMQTFNNISFDLMYGVTNQTCAQWQYELQMAARQYPVQHISAYNLTIEKGTDFFTMHKNGKLILPSHDEVSNMYEVTNTILTQYDFHQYEVSNYCKTNFECIHNLGYWNIIDYIGIGPGAHGRIHIDGQRYETMNIHLPNKWKKEVLHHGVGLQKSNIILLQDQIAEILFMGLRIRQGIDLDYTSAHLNINLLEHINIKNLKMLENEDCIKFSANKIMPTIKGMCFVNSLVKFLLAQ